MLFKGQKLLSFSSLHGLVKPLNRIDRRKLLFVSFERKVLYTASYLLKPIVYTVLYILAYCLLALFTIHRYKKSHD